MQATRRRILEILKINSRATVTELADALNMAPVSVRHHLDILQGQDLVASQVWHKRTVGRPEQVYVLTDASNEFFPQNFRGLAGEVLDELKNLLPASEIDNLLRRMAQNTLDDAPVHRGNRSADERLGEVATFLNQKGYLAHWERQNDHQIALHTCNCPYAGLASEHPELCRMDMILVTDLMSGLSAQPPRCVGRLANGENRCTYVFELPVGVAPEVEPQAR